MPLYGNVRKVDGLVWEIDANNQQWGVTTTLQDGWGITLSSTVDGFTADIDADTVQFVVDHYGNAAAGGAHWEWDSGTHTGMIRILPDSATIANLWLNNNKSQTGMAWCRSDGTSRQVIMARYHGSNNVFHWNQIVDPTGDFHFNSSGVISGASGDKDGSFWTDNVWHCFHQVYNVSDGYFRWYVDGDEKVSEDVGTDSGNGLIGYNNNTQWFSVGSRSDHYESLRGKLAVSRFYNRALTSHECAQQFENERQRFYR